MKINKLTASFGKLQNESLSFHDGLNVIYAPNESGKSTWCAFIRAMLYGVDSGERARSGYLPDKLRYAPWSGAPMEGTMELTADRCDITIARSTHAKGAPMREFSAVYTGTSTPVEGLNSANAGEMLTGVSKEVFRRSAFIAQGTVAVTGSPELEKRISAIVSSGEEQTSFSEADERLRAWTRKRRYNRRGLLPELEGKIDDTQRRLDDMGGSLQDIEAMERELEENRKECVRLEAAVNESRRKQRHESLEKLAAGRNELTRCSLEHDLALKELSEKRDELRAGRFGGCRPEDVETQITEDLDRLDALRDSSGKKPNILPALLCFILAAAGAALYAAFDQLAYIIVSAVSCIGALFLLFRYSSAKKAVETQRSERRALLKKYGAADEDGISAEYEAYLRLLDAVDEAEALEQSCRRAYEDARVQQTALEENTVKELDFVSGTSEAARLSRELARKRAAAEKLSAQIASINGRLAAMGDPLVLASSLSCMRDEYEIISNEYDALTLASDTLRQADDEIQRRFSPELGRVAAEYMSLVTGGRYADVLINRDFSARTRTRDDAIARDAEYLSAGTMDLMYLAVRLAVCELALPEGESCPLIIDDALVNLDEARLSQAMELLAQIAKKRQVILFTCRKV